jgi:hypothetical protein
MKPVQNNKGVTIFEMLITISIGSMVLVMLFSILTTTLITKNVIDYTNRLDDEVYDINDFLSYRFQRLGYKSIMEYDLSTNNEETQTQFVFLLANEFRPVFETVADTTQISLKRDVFKVYILFMDVETDTIYFDVLFEVDIYDETDLTYTGPTYDEQIDTFLNQINSYVSLFVNSPSNPISNPNLVLHEGSVIRFKTDEAGQHCLRGYQEDRLSIGYGIEKLVSNCSSAFLEFNLVVSYRLNTGGILPQKEYNSTLLY